MNDFTVKVRDSGLSTPNIQYPFEVIFTNTVLNALFSHPKGSKSAWEIRTFSFMS